MPTPPPLRWIALAWLGVGLLTSHPDRSILRNAIAADSGAPLDPAAWGSDHVGRPIPEFVSGDECLFCHRLTIGVAWPTDPHGSTLRELDEDSRSRFQTDPALKPLANDAELLLGHDHQLRLLKRAPAYGQLALLSAAITPSTADSPATVTHPESPHWDDQKFNRSCAGCHTTAVDAETSAFSALSLDCYVCHGNVSLEHTNDTSRILLSHKRNNEPREIISLCGQCHLRGGASRSTGRPWPNNFVAGNNLFRDFQVDLSDAAIDQLAPLDRHVFENARDVALRGDSSITCLTCHQVHGGTTEKHHGLAESRLCRSCHDPARPKSEPTIHTPHSRVCEY